LVYGKIPLLVKILIEHLLKIQLNWDSGIKNYNLK